MDGEWRDPSLKLIPLFCSVGCGRRSLGIFWGSGKMSRGEWSARGRVKDAS